MQCILNSIPRKLINLYYKETDDKYNILTIASGIISVNTTTMFVWINIDGTKSVDDIANILIKHFKFINDEEISKVQLDICRIIKHFIDAEVITVKWKSFIET